ncbi:cytochrome d ubiquinol oxidase subunit II [Spongisporangium articulatum]|uniref:Cytochrome d ubiquinol oxidase subunit II n=1 Tax=Spongisporangium articulatum TaxID=3362603 RepID=A0ABW8AIS3_9ACTN
MELTTFWFGLIGLLWVGYLVLEGFDFGVGMLMPFLARNETERRVVINTIGPVWDGNEVWLLVAGGATFAAFPEWYASLFSGFYLALLLILVALILRGVAFEYRGKIDSETWRQRWDLAIIVGSFLPALLWGVAFANIVRGVPLDADHQFTGTLLTLLNPYALLGGLTTLLLFALHGALFLGLKTRGPIQAEAVSVAFKLAVPAVGVAAAWALWTQLAYGAGWTWLAVLVAAGALIGAAVAAFQRREGLGFALTSLALAAAVVLIFGSLFPDVLPSTTDPAFSLNTTNASSTHYTLVVMTWVAVLLTPFVLLYQSWTYWVFRRRIGTEDIPPTAGLPRLIQAPAER